MLPIFDKDAKSHLMNQTFLVVYGRIDGIFEPVDNIQQAV